MHGTRLRRASVQDPLYAPNYYLSMDGFRELTSRRVAKFVGARFFSVFDYVRDPLKFQVGSRPPAAGAATAAGCRQPEGWHGEQDAAARTAANLMSRAAPLYIGSRIRPPRFPQAALECLSFADYSLAIKARPPAEAEAPMSRPERACTTIVLARSCGRGHWPPCLHLPTSVAPCLLPCRAACTSRSVAAPLPSLAQRSTTSEALAGDSGCNPPALAGPWSMCMPTRLLQQRSTAFGCATCCNRRVRRRRRLEPGPC